MSRMKHFMITLVAFALFLCPVAVHAAGVSTLAENTSAKDTGNNYYFSGNNINLEKGKYFSIFGSGREVVVNESASDDIMALAGYNISVDATRLGSSLFAAGYSIAIKDTTADGNMVLAAKEINIDDKSKANVVIAAAQEIIFKGEAKSLHLYADRVVLNGKVDGDLDISAKEVEIGEDTEVTGTLIVACEEEPVVPSTAKIGKVNFEKTEITAEQAEKESMGNKIIRKLKSSIYWIIAMGIVGLILCWLLPNQLDEAHFYIRRKTALVFASGAIALITIPIVIILCAITVVGIPLAILLGIIYGITLAVSMAFTGTVVGKTILPFLPSAIAAILGIAVFEVLRTLPYAGFAIGLISALFTLGYFSQSIWSQRSKRKMRTFDASDLVIEEKQEN